MLIKIGIFIWIWLWVGLLSGFKLIYIDKFIETAEKKIEDGNTSLSDSELELYNNIKNKKLFFLVAFTLLGFISFAIDTVATFSKKKKIE